MAEWKHDPAETVVEEITHTTESRVHVRFALQPAHMYAALSVVHVISFHYTVSVKTRFHSDVTAVKRSERALSEWGDGPRASASCWGRSRLCVYYLCAFSLSFPRVQADGIDLAEVAKLRSRQSAARYDRRYFRSKSS